MTITSIDLGDGLHSDGCPDVDVSGDGGASGVVPVLVVGSQLLGHVGLDNVGPFGQLDLAGLLEECGQTDGELLLVHILNRDGVIGSHFEGFC